MAECLKMPALFSSETTYTFHILIIPNFGNYLNMVEESLFCYFGTRCTYILIPISSEFFLDFLVTIQCKKKKNMGGLSEFNSSEK